MGHFGKSKSASRPAIRACLLSAAILAAQSASAAINWIGTGANTSWTTTTNWSNNSGPATTDTVIFTDTGSITLPAETTSVLNANRTIGGLSFSDTAGKYHTLDLATHTLTVNGNLNFNLDQSTTTTTLKNGVLLATNANLNVGIALTGNGSGTADLSGLTSFSITGTNVQVGTSAAGSATGTLKLPASTTINVATVTVGNNGTGTVNLGKTDSIQTTQLTIGQGNGTGSMSALAGSSVTIGSVSQLTNLNLAYNVGANVSYTNSPVSSSINLSGSTLNAYFGQMTIGNMVGQTAGDGNAFGTLTGGNAGTVTIGAVGNLATVQIGYTSGSGASSTGIVDFSNMNALNANISTLSVGVALVGGASGTFSLPATSTINAGTIVVGNAGSGYLALGTTTTLAAGQLSIGINTGSGTVSMPSGGSLTIGSPTLLTALNICTNVGINTSYTNSIVSSTVTAAGSTLNAYLGQIIVGNMVGQTASGGGAIGTFTGGNSGIAIIGSVANPATVEIGFTSPTGASSTGIVDFSGMTSLNANISTLSVGVAQGGGASGTFSLPATSTINAGTIVIGNAGAGTLTLGKNSTIITGQLSIGINTGSGSVSASAGGSFTLGSVAQPTSLSICSNVGINSAYTNSNINGSLNVAGSTFNAYLGQIIVGNMVGGSAGGASAIGSLIGGNAGTVTMGAVGNLATVQIGYTSPGGASSSGTVDFSGMNSLIANINTLSIGVSLGGGATGTFKLPATSSINAGTIVVGDNGGGGDTLALGTTTTILASQLTIGMDDCSGYLTVPAGGTFTLGSAAQPANLTMASGAASTNATDVGILNLASATFVAYLNSVVIGDKQIVNYSGAGQGALTIGANPANYITANAITLGSSRSSGTINYAGGQFFAGSISQVAGAGAFNWTGGKLSVGTFGTPAQLFNLNNSGTGTLAPGSAGGAIGTTIINGNYTQAAQAATTIRIAGSSAGSGNDLVSISGSATLNGTLNLTLINGFVPAVGQDFLIETYASHIGTFAFVSPPALTAGVAFQLDYTTNPAQLQVHMVAPVAQSYTATGAQGTWSTAAGWSGATTPTTTSAVSIANSDAFARTLTVAASTTVHQIILQGTASPQTLEILQGVQLGVSYQLSVGTGATLSGGGQILGNVVLSGGTIASGLSLGMLASSGGRLDLNQGTLIANALTIGGGTLWQTGGTLTASSFSQTAGTGSFGGSQAAYAIPAVAISGGLTTFPTGVPKVLVTSSLSITGTGTIDLTTNDALVHSTAVAQSADYLALQGELTSGHLLSSSTSAITGLALEKGSDYLAQHGLSATFDGQPVTTTDLLVKYTYFGDVNLDGVISSDDYLQMDWAYLHNVQNGGWATGDFNGNGGIDAGDYALLDNAYQLQSGTLADGMIAAHEAEFGPTYAAALNALQTQAAPEPATLAFLGMGLLGLWRRRKR